MKEVDYLEIETRLEEISAGLTVFTDTIEDEFHAAGEDVRRYLEYVVGTMPMLHMIRRSLWSLQEEIKNSNEKAARS